MDLSAIKKKLAKNPQREIERFRGAVERGIEQFNVVKNRMNFLISKEESAIFDVYRLILKIPRSFSRSKTRFQKKDMSRNTRSVWFLNVTWIRSQKSTTPTCASAPPMSGTRRNGCWKISTGVVRTSPTIFRRRSLGRGRSLAGRSQHA